MENKKYSKAMRWIIWFCTALVCFIAVDVSVKVYGYAQTNGTVLVYSLPAIIWAFFARNLADAIKMEITSDV